MSIKDRLAKKTGDLIAPLVGEPRIESASVNVVPAEARTPRTGPGQMLAFRSHMQENDKRVKELEDKLSEFDGSLPVKLLDPKVIRPSKWANRHISSYSTPMFEVLKSEIAASGGNVQPIRVRPSPDRPGEFEIIFGHRRHQACLQLGILVSALIGPANDKQLFAAMDRENRTREDLAPFEQGETYRLALDEGLYPSLRQLASDLGVDKGNASKAIAIARLPSEVLSAFDSPNQIQYRWGKELLLALQKDPDGVVERAVSIRNGKNVLRPIEVLNRLIGKEEPNKPISIALKHKGKVVGQFQRKRDGSLTLSLSNGVLNDDSFEKLRIAVEGLLAPA